MKNIASVIKSKRIAHGMTQKELAQKLLVSRQAVSSWERNKTYPDLGKLKEIARIFDLTMDELLYSDVKASRTLQKYYKRLLYSITFIIVIVLSILLYRIIVPPHIAIISNHKGVCDIDTVSIRKTDDYSNDDVSTYYFYLYQQVEYDFGTYCVPLRTSVKVTNDEWENAVVHTVNTTPGFIIENIYFYNSLENDYMFIYIHHSITVIKSTRGTDYWSVGNVEAEFEFPYQLEEATYTNELIGRGRL